MPTLTEVIGDIEAGFYTVPEIQRRFVWKNPQIRDLISSIYTEKWDNFGNITLISKKANNYFKFKDPSVYLNELKNIEPELLKKHFIPMDSSLWNIDNYDKFLKERISLIADAIETFGIKVLKSSE